MRRIVPSSTFNWRSLSSISSSIPTLSTRGVGIGGVNGLPFSSSSLSSCIKPLSTITNRLLPRHFPSLSSTVSSPLLWQQSNCCYRHWFSSSTIPGAASSSIDVHEAQHFRTECALNDDPITSNLPNLPSTKQSSQQSSSSTSSTATTKSTMIHDSDLSSSNIGDTSCGSSGPEPNLGPAGPPAKHPPMPGQQPQPGTAEGALHSKAHINPSKGGPTGTTTAASAAGVAGIAGVAGVASEGILGTGEFVSFTKLPSSRDVTSHMMNETPRRELATESEPDVQQSQTSDPKDGHVFVVAIDGSDEAHWAWETATSLVRKDRDSLVMLTVPVPVSPYSHSPIEDGIGSSYHHEMIKRDADHWNVVKTSYENLCKERGIKKYNYKLLPASNVPGDDLLTYAEHVGANFMVVGHRGMSAVKRLMLGSVAYFMLQYAKCNVVLAKRQAHQQFSSPNPTPKIEADSRPRRWAPQ